MFKAQVFAIAVVLTTAVDPACGVRSTGAALLYGALLTAGTLVATGLLAVGGFDAAWSQFHVIAFSNDLWKLDPDTDHLIQMYPEAFWFEITAILGAATLLEAAALALVSGAYLFTTRERVDAQQAVPRPEFRQPDLRDVLVALGSHRLTPTLHSLTAWLRGCNSAATTATAAAARLFRDPVGVPRYRRKRRQNALGGAVTPGAVDRLVHAA
jgi:hypothetical protein